MVYGAIVANVCSISHGQPPSGFLRRAMTARRRSMGLESSAIATFLHTQAIEREDHAGSGSPDVVPAEGNVDDVDLAIAGADASATRAMVLRVEQEAHGHLESALDFTRVEQQLETRLHERHYRCDEKAADDHVI